MWILPFVVLVSGDVLSGEILVKYSGETATWCATADSEIPGERAEFEVSELVTEQVVASGSSPIENGVFVFSMTYPRVGLYSGRVRACNDDLCSEWTESSQGTGTTCGLGNYAFAILAPPGAPEL